MKAISAVVFTVGGWTRRDRSSTAPRDWTLNSIHDLHRVLKTLKIILCFSYNQFSAFSCFFLGLWFQICHFNTGFVFCTLFKINDVCGEVI